MFKVRDLMTDRLVSLRESDTLLDAKTAMELARIRHVPITDDKGAFLGLLTHRDMLSAAVSQLAEIDSVTQDDIYAGIPVTEVMRVGVRVCEPETPLLTAARFLLKTKYGCLPVVESERLVGILTESDFVRLSIQLMEALDSDADSSVAPEQ